MANKTMETVQKRDAVGIASISVSGFKSIYTKLDVTLRPLTILAGANSSGKSSLMQPLLLLKQTLESQGDPGPLLLNGSNVRFTRTEQLLSKGGQNEFGIEVTLNTGESVAPCFKKNKNGVELLSMGFASKKNSGVVKPVMTHEEIVGFLPENIKDIGKEFEIKKGETAKWRVVRERCFLEFVLGLGDPVKFNLQFGALFPSSNGIFAPIIKEVIHVPGLRGNPRRTYPRMACGPDFPGTFEDYAASIIADWQSRKDKRLLKLADALKSMGLTSQVKTGALDDTQIEVKVGRLPQSAASKNDMVSIADVGFGVSQTLPVIVALLVAKPGQLVYLEQPEIHLHPRAQRQLAKILAEAANRGVITVVETHSAILLRTIQTLIATDSLPKDKVAMHWLSRNEQGQTELRTAELDDSGAYGEWPEDFGDIELDVEQSYLDAVEQRGLQE